MRQLHREFLRAGSNVMQTFTFYASDDKLVNRGHAQRFTVSLAARSYSCVFMFDFHTWIGNLPLLV